MNILYITYNNIFMSFFVYLHQNINIPLLYFFNDFTQNIFIEKIVSYMADIPIFFLPIFLIFWWFYYTFKDKDNNKKHHLLFVFYSTLLAIVSSLIIQYFFHFERPEQSLEWRGNLILKHLPDASFPSDHASVWMAFLVAIYLFWWKKIAKYFTPFLIIMLLSRIAWWVHWPLDIWAWVILWSICAIIVYKLRNFHILQKVNNFLLKIASFLKL